MCPRLLQQTYSDNVLSLLDEKCDSKEEDYGADTEDRGEFGPNGERGDMGPGMERPMGAGGGIADSGMRPSDGGSGGPGAGDCESDSEPFSLEAMGISTTPSVEQGSEVDKMRVLERLVKQCRQNPATAGTNMDVCGTTYTATMVGGTIGDHMCPTLLQMYKTDDSFFLLDHCDGEFTIEDGCNGGDEFGPNGEMGGMGGGHGGQFDRAPQDMDPMAMMGMAMELGIDLDDLSKVDSEQLEMLGMDAAGMQAMMKDVDMEPNDPSYYVMPPFARDIAENMFVNMDPNSGAHDGKMLIGRNQDPRKMYTFFTDAEQRKEKKADGTLGRCAADGSQFWVKVGRDKWVKRSKTPHTPTPYVRGTMAIATRF